MKISQKEISDWGLENFFNTETGSSPSHVKIIRGRATQIGFGRWEAYITDDGTDSGNPLTGDLSDRSKAICIPSVSRDTNDVTQIPFSGINTMSGSTITFNAVESNLSVGLLGGDAVGLALETNNVQLNYILIYFDYAI